MCDIHVQTFITLEVPVSSESWTSKIRWHLSKIEIFFFVYNRRHTLLIFISKNALMRWNFCAVRCWPFDFYRFPIPRREIGCAVSIRQRPIYPSCSLDSKSVKLGTWNRIICYLPGWMPEIEGSRLFDVVK